MRLACTVFFFVLAGVATVGGCSSDDGGVPAAPPPVANVCEDPRFRFPNGGDGHADPLGAAAARQARAGKITRASDVVQSVEARHKARLGDFVLANDKIAVYIEAENGAHESDGYFAFGGEILAIDVIGVDGRPAGLSTFGEAVMFFGLQTIAPEKVSVLADGSDGKAAIVRAQGTLKTVASLDFFSNVFPDKYDFPVAIDYVLEPGAMKVATRISVANATNAPVDLTNKLHLATFQGSRSQTFHEGGGFGPIRGEQPFVAWDNGPSSAWLYRSPLGPMAPALTVAGMEVLNTPAFPLAPCEHKTVDYIDVLAGRGLDDVLEAKRVTYGEKAWRVVRGSVRETGGTGLAGALVHVRSNGAYVMRAITDQDGGFSLHVPIDQPVDFTPTLKGWPVPAPSPLTPGAGVVDLVLPRRASIAVTAIDADTRERLPVRVQVIPAAAVPEADRSFGVESEGDGLLYREYVMSGEATLPVPPGEHRVIVSRGYEYELHDEVVTAEAGKTTQVSVALKHSVDSTGVMCGDFHIHSMYSVDSSDPVELKVRGAIADGLEIPVSTEHEYVIDFQPVIQKLGLTKWAFGLSAEELTTFKWGHFGVFPLSVDPEATNNGAIDSTKEYPPVLFPQIAARPDDPLFIVNHPRSAALNQGYFEVAGFDRATLTGSNKEVWSDVFGALEVFNDSDFERERERVVADWFAFLNAGRKMPAVGSSDSHSLRSRPVGYPRTCMRFGHDDPTQLNPGLVRDALAAGASTISGGLFMTVEGPNGVGPGGTTTAGKYKVVVASPSWVDTTSLEVIVDGTTAQTIAIDPTTGGPGPGHRYTLEVDVAPSQSKPQHWVVFHAKGDGDLAPVHPGRNAFAVSNPVFF
ncbi:MAG: PHP domain-containing protein [Labilithrix sp.]|nr:PHP domain-containing protein [Labilithrix sp.]MCW5817127.1 PHP domain-containing protein [Labilithrix sp.]